MSSQDWALAALENPKPRKPLPVAAPISPAALDEALELDSARRLRIWAPTLLDKPQAAKDPAAMLASALELVRAAGYRVTEPKATVAPKPIGLNAIGKPYSALFDPRYRMKYKTSRRVACTGTSTAAGNGARSIYREIMERKHAGNAALFAEVLERQGMR